MSFFRLYYRVYFRLVIYRMHNVRRLSMFSYVSSISLVLLSLRFDFILVVASRFCLCF